MEADGGKRKHSFRQQPNKKAKTDDGSALKSGFGAKMLAKMGFKGEGGLGKEGTGISEPIQVVNRGTKGGIGIVAEKSEQQRREERRKAEVNGEKYVDTSEEERAERKKKKAKARGEARPAGPRPKKTVFEMEAAGMHVPLALQSIIDATTGASTPTSGVSLRGSDLVPFENSLQARVRRDLNSFSEAFEQLQVESETIAPQEWALQKELEALVRQMDELEDMQARIESLRTGTFEVVCEGLKSLRAAYPSKPLHRESIAVIHRTSPKQSHHGSRSKTRSKEPQQLSPNWPTSYNREAGKSCLRPTHIRPKLWSAARTSTKRIKSNAAPLHHTRL
jgi:tuftelin-interacting protein 11